MSRRPTPETDAAVIPLNGDYVVWHGFARRMECERDEARTELEEYRSIAELVGAKKAVSEKEKAIRERDEARNKMADALQEVDLLTLDFERVKQELHEARAEAARWEAIAFWEASANSSTKKELHSTDPMWQKPLSTSKHVPHAPNP